MTSSNKNPASLLAAASGAALTIWLYLNGEAIGAAIAGEAGREAIIAAIWSHVGWGVVTAPLIMGYLVLRWRAARAAYAQRGALERFGKFVLWALAAVIIFLIVTGPIVVWTYGSDLKVFDLFVIPTPTGKVPVIHDPLELAHVWAAKAAPWLAGLDAALCGAALLRARREAAAD
ncbi:hypothetical protein [Hyphococcus sp.]|uniref:hypothetical protein n=1 Tax=Hyphococcus sp. TaxID=2038636 RepID=UPI003CCBB99C